MSWKRWSRPGLVLVLGSLIACAVYLAYRWIAPDTAGDKNAFLGWLVPAVIEVITLVFSWRVSRSGQESKANKDDEPAQDIFTLKNVFTVVLAVLAVIGIISLFLTSRVSQKIEIHGSTVENPTVKHSLINVENGVSLEAMEKLRDLASTKLLLQMGKDAREIDPTKLEQQVQKEVENYRALKAQIAQISGDDPESQRLKAEAEAAMEVGDFDRAHESLLALRRHGRNAARDFLRADAENCAALAALDKQRDFSAAGYQRAADYYAEAAQNVADIDPAAARNYRVGH